MRRILLSLVIVYCIDFVWLQLAALNLLVLPYLMFIVHYLPFDTKLATSLAIINEICLLLLMYHLFMFTDFVTDADRKMELGWVVLLITCLGILINLGAILVSTLKLLITKIKLWWRSRKAKTTKHPS